MNYLKVLKKNFKKYIKGANMIDIDTKKTILEDINMMINKIKKCNSKTMYNIYLYELKCLYCLCEELNITDYPNIDNYSNKSILINENKFYDKYRNQLSQDKAYHLEFSKNSKNIDYYKYQDLNNYSFQIEISATDNIELMCEFLNDYDPRIYNLFKQLLVENRIIVTEEINDSNEMRTPAYIVFSYGSYLPYVVINSEKLLTDSINLVHELGHVYDNNLKRSNKIFNQKKINCLDEVISYYFQFVYVDYLKNRNLFKQDVQNIKYVYNYPFTEFINKIGPEYEKEKKIEESDIDEYLNYTYGIAIAYHFLERYRDNPEKTKNEINNFIALNGQYNMMEMLEKFKLKDELIDSKILRKYI